MARSQPAPKPFASDHLTELEARLRLLSEVMAATRENGLALSRPLTRPGYGEANSPLAASSTLPLWPGELRGPAFQERTDSR